MKKRLFFILFLLFLYLNSFSLQEILGEEKERFVREISLDEVMHLALKNSLDIQIAKFDTYIERTSLLKRESIFDTFFNAHTGYLKDKRKQSSSLLGSKSIKNTYSFGIEKKFLTGTTLSINAQDSRIYSDSPFNLLNPYHGAEVSLSLNQPLGKNFFGLADRANIRITKIDIENREFTSLNEIERALFNIQVAYWKLVLKEEELNIKKDMLKEAEKLYDIYQRKYELGLVEKVDLLAAQVNVRVRENSVLSAIFEREAAKNDLLFLLNVTDTSIELKPLDRLKISPFSVELNAVLREAIDNRRDYKIVMKELKKNDIVIEIKRNALWPEIDLEASYARNGISSKYKKSWRDISRNDDPQIFVGLNVRFSLENRDARSELNRAELIKERLLLILKRIERLILREINNKIVEVNTLKNQVQLSSMVVELEQKKLEEEMRRLKYGRSSSDIIIRYEEDLLNARLSLAQALFSFRVSLSELELVKNTLLNKYWKGGI